MNTFMRWVVHPLSCMQPPRIWLCYCVTVLLCYCAHWYVLMNTFMCWVVHPLSCMQPPRSGRAERRRGIPPQQRRRPRPRPLPSPSLPLQALARSLRQGEQPSSGSAHLDRALLALVRAQERPGLRQLWGQEQEGKVGGPRGNLPRKLPGCQGAVEECPGRPGQALQEQDIQGRWVLMA